MKMKALKSFHTSGVGTVHKGDTFEIHDDLGREHEKRGLAEVVAASTDTKAGADASEPHAKKEPEVLNKMEATPKTKKKAGAEPEVVPAPDLKPE